MLTKSNPETIQDLIDRCKVLENKLKTLKSEMQADGPRELELNVLYTENLLNRLAAWADRCVLKRRNIHAKAESVKKRKAMENKRRGK